MSLRDELAKVLAKDLPPVGMKRFSRILDRIERVVNADRAKGDLAKMNGKKPPRGGSDICEARR